MAAISRAAPQSGSKMAPGAASSRERGAAGRTTAGKPISVDRPPAPREPWGCAEASCPAPPRSQTRGVSLQARPPPSPFPRRSRLRHFPPPPSAAITGGGSAAARGATTRPGPGSHQRPSPHSQSHLERPNPPSPEPQHPPPLSSDPAPTAASRTFLPIAALPRTERPNSRSTSRARAG